MKAYIFPGQGAQYPGMGKDLFESSKIAAKYFNEADEILGFKISDIMFDGSAEDLRQSRLHNQQFFFILLSLQLVKEKVCYPKWLLAIH